ncbi:hypothetical protein ACQJ21_06455 [Klebsiella michiganensis]|uniref:hypothetical protein n=1 Tax=Klebsiella michiganensis TaxID=1134687 RepID=UPI003D019C25
MASKNNIIVHIGDDLLYETILKEVEKSKKSKSRYILDILHRELKDDILRHKLKDNDRYAGIFSSGVISAYPANMTIDSERQITPDGIIKLKKIDECIDYCYQSRFFCMMSFSFNQLIASEKSNALDIIPKVISERWEKIEEDNGKADINLVFINRVDVRYFQCNEGRFFIRMKINFHVSRFMLASLDINDDFLRVDFLNIKYLRFKNVAINGRESKTYDRFLYIKPTRETSLGGFFAGLRYVPKNIDVLKDEIDKLLINQDSKKGMLAVPGKFIKLHINLDQIKVNQSSFRKGFDNIEERRKLHDSGGDILSILGDMDVKS